MFSVSVQPHVQSEKVTEASSGASLTTVSGAALTATTDAGPQQAPYTIIVSHPS